LPVFNIKNKKQTAFEGGLTLKRDGDGMAVPKAEPVLKKKKLFVMPDAYVLLFFLNRGEKSDRADRRLV
jgi:hypothetical protein